MGVPREHAALGRPVGYDEAMSLAADGEPAAKRLVDDAGRGLGTLLAAIANLTTPRLIVLGGEGVGLVDVAHDAIREGIAQAPQALIGLMHGDNAGKMLVRLAS